MPTALSKLAAVGGLLALSACASDYNLEGEPPDVNPGDVTECGFSPISGSVMSIYDCNPVFSSSVAGADVTSVGFLSTPVVEQPFYQIWYVTSNTSGTGYSLNYAISSDGTNWQENPSNPLLNNQPGQWDQDAMDAVKVVWDPTSSQYVMDYQGITFPANQLDPGQWGLGVATSPDGVAWTKYAGNPVIDFTQSDPFSTAPQPCWPLALTRSGAGLTGYIAAGVVDIWSGQTAPNCDVYEANASSLSSWQMGGQPVLSAGGTWDTAGVADAAVVDYNGTRYMFYVGFTDWVQGNGYVSGEHSRLLLATSTDAGHSWTKQPDPLPVARTDNGDVRGVGAQVIGHRIHLWITDYYESEGGQAIGYYLYEPDIDPHP